MKSSSSHLTLGQRGEAFAAAYLEQLNYKLVAANFTVPIGRTRKDVIINAELDIVAYDQDVLCFVEVKTRASDWFATPEVNVDRRKRRQIARAAREYRRMFDLVEDEYRFDVVTMVLSEGEPPRIEVLKNFWRAEKKRKWIERFYD